MDPGWSGPFVALLLLIIGQDLYCRQISSWLCLVLGGMGGLALLQAGVSPGVWCDRLGTALALLGIGFVGFVRGLWGGGDAKLLAAFGMWLGSGLVAGYLLWVGLLSGGVAMVLLILRYLADRGPGGPALFRHPLLLAQTTRLPGAVALGGSGLLLLHPIMVPFG